MSIRGAKILAIFFDNTFIFEKTKAWEYACGISNCHLVFASLKVYTGGEYMASLCYEKLTRFWPNDTDIGGPAVRRASIPLSFDVA
jgi:hypothetical protein